MGLEFKALTQCSGSPEYADAVDQVDKRRAAKTAPENSNWRRKSIIT